MATDERDRRDRREPQPTPTTIDLDLDSATELTRGPSTLPGPVPPRQRPPTPAPALHATKPESDQTSLVRRDDAFVDLPPGSVVDDVYEIDAKLGEGAMGEVYAARHVKLGKRVAIKVIGPRLSGDPAAIERFAQEARALARIQHPAIVAVDHVGELTDGRAFFVMEYLRGEALFDRLQRERLSLSKALRILDQIARGLEAAHAQGVTHRDLKPENIFLAHVPGESSIVKLLDFGLSKLRSDVDDRSERTQSGVAIGTPMYMSPEQMRGPDIDHRTDIYALGCVAYELVLGTPPFPRAKGAPELYAAHLHEAPPLPRAIWPEIPPQLDLVLFAMLAKDPDHRPTLAQVRSVIATVRTATPSQRAPTEHVMYQPPRSPVAARTVTIALATLVVGLLIGAALMSRRASKIVPDAAVPSAAAVVPPAPPIAAAGVGTAAAGSAGGGAPPAPSQHRGSGPGSARAISRPSSSRPAISNASQASVPVLVPVIDAGIPAVAAPPAVPDRATAPPRHVDRDLTLNPFAPRSE